MQYIGLMAMVEDQIVECFRHGGGVPYSAFPRSQAIMAEDSGAVHDATLIRRDAAARDGADRPTRATASTSRMSAAGPATPST